MDNNEKISEWVISYKQIGLIIFTLLFGIVAGLLVTNSQTGSPTTFTTTELIGFVLSIILSGASIVLAVAAISLGKYSELAIMHRSDESIRLQNEVFVKTTDALQRIESSTGVTEKRIEDIISGRVGDISHQIAEMATGSGKYRSRDPRDLEEDIRKSLLESFKEESSGTVDEDERRKKRQKRVEEQKKYQSAHEKTLYAIANKDGVSIEKIGHGDIGESGTALFDGIYKKEDKRFAVSTFKKGTSTSILTEFIGNTATELAKNYVDSVYMIIFGTEAEEELDQDVREHFATMKDVIVNKIHLFYCDYENAEDPLNNINL